MRNIFGQIQEFVEQPKRNNFDLSFTNNFTGDFGYLYPVFCKEVLPGDSWSIKPSFGLRFMPLVFPVQTRMKANLHFFYVRNRNLWKDWMDFIGRTKTNLNPPYLGTTNFTGKLTGSLLDYLGLPTTLVGDYGSHNDVTTQPDLNFFPVSNGIDCIVNNTSASSVLALSLSSYFNPFNYTSGGVHKVENLSHLLTSQNQITGVVSSDFFSNAGQGSQRTFVSNPFDFEYLEGSGRDAIVFRQHRGTEISNEYLHVYIWVKQGDDWIPKYVLQRPVDFALYRDQYEFQENDFSSELLDDGDIEYYFDLPDIKNLLFHEFTLNSADFYWLNNRTFDEVLQYLKSIGTTQVRVSITSVYYNTEDPSESEYSSRHVGHIDAVAFSADSSINSGIGAISEIRVRQNMSEGINDVGHMGSLSPYYTGDLHINALPPRAYDSIYNAFYRNQFNDPFILNGQKEYNKFIRTNEGGLDSNKYELYRRNWELDFLTSAKQSPVDGDLTPLVGVSGSGEFTFQNPDETTYTVKPVIGEDGHTLTGIDSMEGTPANNSGLRRLVDLISVGISINDFRNVNSLQRWLETNLRRGYRYKDQLMSHFGVDAKLEELDMPEFLGGMSETVIVNQINQSVDMTGDPSGLGDFSKVLGSYAGQASILAESKHTITRYCDEHGFIMGILSVTPVPCYSQLLPKFFVKDNLLDYFFPEFGHIGNQPITYKEVCPLQTFAEGDSLNDVFGYQRAWYDYIASTDEVHGDFRTNLNGFLINRVFNSKPELGKDFIECNKDSMTNPFSVTDDTNKILGQIYFETYVKREIPKFGIPRIE